MDSLRFVLISLARWMNREQQQVIECSLTENRVLREMNAKKRPRFTEKHRLRLAAKAKSIRFSKLIEIANSVTPETLMNWIRMRIAEKYDGSMKRGVRRSEIEQKNRDLVPWLAKENPD